MSTSERLRKLKEILEFIVWGQTLPEAVEPRDDERTALQFTIIRSAAIKANAGLALLAAEHNEKPKRMLKLKKILKFIANERTIPEAKEPRDDFRIERPLHIISSALIKAKEGLVLLDAADEKPKRRRRKKP